MLRLLAIRQGQWHFHEMRGSIVTSFLAALAGQQKPLGRLTQLPDATKEFMSCKETYGKGSETCGDRVRRGFPSAEETRRAVAEL